MCQHKRTLDSLPKSWRPTLADLCRSAGVSPTTYVHIRDCGCCNSREAMADDDYICLWCRYYTDGMGLLREEARLVWEAIRLDNKASA